MTGRALALTLLAAATLAACTKNPDADLWSCQLDVQKGNAGKDAAAQAERLRDIVACMEDRGYRLDSARPACLNGSVDPACYREK
ncbi:MAG TPA: hypothetical protein VF816_02940 [Rhodocyclaceae bacterium]